MKSLRSQPIKIDYIDQNLKGSILRTFLVLLRLCNSIIHPKF